MVNLHLYHKAGRSANQLEKNVFLFSTIIIIFCIILVGSGMEHSFLGSRGIKAIYR